MRSSFLVSLATSNSLLSLSLEERKLLTSILAEGATVGRLEGGREKEREEEKTPTGATTLRENGRDGISRRHAKGDRQMRSSFLVSLATSNSRLSLSL